MKHLIFALYDVLSTNFKPTNNKTKVAIVPSAIKVQKPLEETYKFSKIFSLCFPWAQHLLWKTSLFPFPSSRLTKEDKFSSIRNEGQWNFPWIQGDWPQIAYGRWTRDSALQNENLRARRRRREVQVKLGNSGNGKRENSIELSNYSKPG